MQIDYKRLSKTVAHALRHAPWLYELAPNEAGWVPVADLLAGLRRHRRQWRELTEDDLRKMVDRPGKRRYEMRDGRIRALYGHSLDAKIRKEPAAPPEVLYHGTAPGTADVILHQGLKSMNRQYVHLSTDVDTARQVGRRKDPNPIILRVLAGQAHHSGIAFYQGNELVWLADDVPPAFIERVEG